MQKWMLISSSCQDSRKSVASFHLALRTTQEMANNFGQAAHQFNLLGKNKQGNNKDKNNIEQP